MMEDEVVLRVGAPGEAPISISSARLINARETVAEFTPVGDHAVGLDLASVPAGEYRLAMNTTGYPTLHFSIEITGETERTLTFDGRTPRIATLSVQAASSGTARSRRTHMLNLALPAKPEAAVMVVGVDLKGNTNYRQAAETWRDDLYHGRTDLGDKLDQRIPPGISDHTIVSIFDFRTGTHEKQIKGTRGWHVMYRTRLGSEDPPIDRPKANDALERRQKAHCISILDVYAYISTIGRDAPGCLRQLHFFSHSWIEGPVLLNTSDTSDTDARDPGDKDPRTKDFLPINLARHPHLPDALTTQTHVRVWGCFGSELKTALQAVAKAKSNTEVVKATDNEEYTGEEVLVSLRQHVFPRSYLHAMMNLLHVDAWGAPPGCSSNYKPVEQIGRSYFHVRQKAFGAVTGWYERNFGVARDLGGYVEYRKLV